MTIDVIGGGGGGGTPSGPAGGDLTGTYPNPTLAATANVEAIITGNVTVAGAIQSGSAAGGDLAGTYPNPTLAAIGSATGPIGDGTHVAAVTIDAKGRVTALTSVPITGGGGSPSGPAGGDLAGTYPNPTLGSTSNVESIISANTTVAGALQTSGGTMTGAIAMGAHKITGLANGTVATDAAAFGQIPTALPPNGAAGGDLTGTYPNPTLAAIGSAIGPIGDGTHVSTVTIDAKGRVTALTSTAITGAPPNGAAGGDLTGTYPNPTLKATGPGATGPIGSTTVTPVVTIDAQGRVTALTSATIAAPALTSAGSTLGADVSLGVSVFTTVFTTSSLATGVWLVRFGCTFNNLATTLDAVAIQMIVGSATATFNGQKATSMATLLTGGSGATDGASLDIMALVTVTVAGTLLLQARNANSGGACSAAAQTPYGAVAGATGWTALKVG